LALFTWCFGFYPKELLLLYWLRRHILNAMIFIFIYVLLDAIRDSIAHHNAYKHLGAFFSRERSEMQKPIFYKYFPMFWDAWHLCKFIQYNLVAFLFIKTLLFPIATIGMSLLFIALYI
jgi:hypothetical protein